MAAGEAIGCFGLTEPDFGSDPARHAHPRQARRRRLGAQRLEDVDHQRLRRRRRRGLGPAPTRASAASSSRPTRPASPPPRSTRSCRCAPRSPASWCSTTCGCRPTPCCPGVAGLRGPLSCLNEARFGIVWGALGAARDCLETALAYSIDREQFGKPIAGFQLTQEKLADMALELGKGMLLALHLGRLKDEHLIRPEQVSLGKLNNVREALAIARECRTHPRRQRHHAGVPGHPAREQPRVGAHLRGHRRDAHARRRPGAHRHRGLPMSAGAHPQSVVGGSRRRGRRGAARRQPVRPVRRRRGGQHRGADVAARRGVGAPRPPSRAWSRTTPWQRAEVLDRAGTEVMARADELGDLLAREEGKTYPEARGEVVRAGADPQVLRGRRAPAARPGAGLGPPRHRGHRDARAGRRRQRHHAVELPDRHPGLEDRPGARVRQHRGLQAGRPGAGERVGARRHPQPRRAARRRPQPRARPRLAGRARC